MSSQRTTGIALIVFGAILLLHQLNIFLITLAHIFALVMVLIGASMLKKSMYAPQRKGLLGGTFFTLLGLAIILFNISSRPFERPLFLGVLFSILAISNLIYFAFSGFPRSVNVFSAIFFAAVGGSMLLIHYEIIDVWQFEEVVGTYWPVALILLGFFIILDNIIQKKRMTPPEGTNDQQAH